MAGVLETLFEGLSKYSWRTFVGIFVASVLLLLFPERFGVRDWVATNKAYLKRLTLYHSHIDTPFALFGGSCVYHRAEMCH